MVLELPAADAVVRCIEAEEANFVFGIASGKLMPLMRALSETNRLRFIGVRHEGAAAMMAAGSYAGTGRIAVALGELGPGGGNLVSGVASAFSNNLPMLVLTSGNPLHASQPSRGMLMETNLVSLFEPITQSSRSVLDGRRIPEMMHAAFREALSGRPGPVHLNIPADILAGTFPYRDNAFAAPSNYRVTLRVDPPADAVEQAARLLSGAKRPLILSGGGVIASDASAGLAAFADRVDAAVVPTQMGIGSLATDHPRFIGHGGIIGGPALIRALAEADVVLALGCRFSSWLWGSSGALLAADARVIQVDTDPLQIGRIVPVEVGIQADAGATLHALIDATGPGPLEPRRWVRGLIDDYAAYRAHLAELAAGGTQSGVPHPAALSIETERLLPENALAVYDGGHTTFWNNDLISAPGPRTRFHEPGLGQLGFGLAYAVALKAAHPDRTVVNITGDGSFGFTLQELDTARREGLPIITIIHNNAAWGVIRLGQQKSGFDFATSLEGTDYAAIARGFGCHGESVSRRGDLAPAFDRALASGLPAVIDCRVAFEPHPGMSHFASVARAPSSAEPLPT